MIGLAALLLVLLFRSIVIPLQAAAMNLLSVAASLGVTVAVFQKGWLGGLLGVKAGPIETFIPVFLFAIVFGLSMDTKEDFAEVLSDYDVVLDSLVGENLEKRVLGPWYAAIICDSERRAACGAGSQRGSPAASLNPVADRPS